MTRLFLTRSYNYSEYGISFHLDVAVVEVNAVTFISEGFGAAREVKL